MKVKATEEFKKNNVFPVELVYIPDAGEIFNVTEERFKKLSGDNPYNAVFVEKVEEDPVKEVIKPTKSVKKKKTK